jgi:deoxyribonuclease V
VTTYGALAEALGHSVAARWVGHFMLHHRHGASCPCHRVVRADGRVGLYAGGGADDKARRLEAEGIPAPRGAVDLERHGLAGFRGDRPLERLQRVQEELAGEVSLRGPRRLPRWVAGVDVSYPSADEGVAAYALVETSSGRLEWSAVIRRPVRFPYISSFLTFRELPLYLALFDEVRSAGRLAELVLVDGTGVLHPRHAGIACHLGVVAGLATIGVTKKLLCGQVRLDDLDPLESRPVVHGGRAVGAAIRPTAGSRRPIFVSPGHRVSLAQAQRLARRLLRGRRLPEPLYHADRLSREAGRR